MIGQAVIVAVTFNLVCAGTLETATFGGTAREPYRSEYRIDLGQNKWCEGQCAALHDIASVQPTQITLQSTSADTPRNRDLLSNTIDRESGAHNIRASSGLGTAAVVMRWRGTCSAAPFTGFPAARTRF